MVGELLGWAVGDGVGIEAAAFDFAASAAEVGGGCGSGEKEFGFTLRQYRQVEEGTIPKGVG